MNKNTVLSKRINFKFLTIPKMRKIQGKKVSFDNYIMLSYEIAHSPVENKSASCLRKVKCKFLQFINVMMLSCGDAHSAVNIVSVVKNLQEQSVV
jgi:hypothetical protein